MAPLGKRLKLLRRYLSNRPHLQDRVIDQWYESIDDSRPVSLWEEEGKKQAIRNSIYAFVFEHIHAGKAGRVRRLPLSRPAIWLSAAAITALFLGIYLFRTLNLPPEPTFITISAQIGKVEKVNLPDSSQVWLKSGTTIRYRSDFNKNDRQLTLINGEAFFEVQKDPERPFIVYTNRVQTKVLGTAFSVQAYRNRSTTQVWVEHGRVQVSDSLTTLQVLTKHQRLVYRHTDHQFQVDSLYWQQALAWQQGVLLLKSASFEELSAQLYELYGVQLTTNEAVIRAQHYNGKFFIETPLDDMLRLITAVHHLQYKRVGNNIIFY